MSTDTPRTDAAQYDTGLRLDSYDENPDWVVAASFATTLERELASVTEERDRLKRELEKREAELVTARKELCSKDPNYTPLLDKYVTDIQAYADRAELAEQQVAASREAAADFRDCVLNQRGALAENGMTGDQVNDVLAEFDDRALSASAEKEGK